MNKRKYSNMSKGDESASGLTPTGQRSLEPPSPNPLAARPKLLSTLNNSKLHTRTITDYSAAQKAKDNDLLSSNDFERKGVYVSVKNLSARGS